MMLGDSQWRAADAGRVATTTEQYVDETRRSGVRDVIAFLRGAHAFVHFTAGDRQAHAARVLATSVEKQARVSSCGRVDIPVGAVEEFAQTFAQIARETA